MRLARLAHGFTLDELGERVSATRQYLNQLEQGTKLPTEQMVEALAAAVGVTLQFFGMITKDSVRPEQCHFRKQRTTPMSVVSQVLARGTLLSRFINSLDRELRALDCALIVLKKMAAQMTDSAAFIPS
ncbi:helix-turn-helix domain-containing protein [Klebsiella pneumoniae]